MTDTSDNRSPEYFDGMADKVQRANYPYEIEQVFRAAADLARECERLRWKLEEARNAGGTEAKPETCTSCGGSGFSAINYRCPWCCGTGISQAQSNRSWRCFYCDQLFTDKELAAEHFGKNTPRCVEYLQNGMGGGPHDPRVKWLQDLQARAEAAEARESELREKVRVLREAAENHVCDYIHHMGTDGSSHGTKPCVICKALAATADEPEEK